MNPIDQQYSSNNKVSGIIMLLVLLILGCVGLFTRWPRPLDVLAPNGVGISFSSLVDFPRIYGERFDSNFFLRDSLIQLDYRTRYFIFRETVYPQVLVGDQGWMYYTNEKNLDYYQRVRPLTPEQTAVIISKLQDLQKELNARDIQFLFIIAPNKETIYPEYLPAGIVVDDNPTWADQITEKLQGTTVPVLDLREALLAGQQSADVYFKTDTHWNPLGAHTAYSRILEALHPSFPILVPHPISDFHQVDEITSGDLAALIHMKNDITEPFTALHARFEKPSRGLKNPPAGQMITIMPDESLPTAVIFRDSFFNGLQPFTSEHFRRVVYVSSFSVDFEIINEEKPDIVILEVAERYIDRLAE